MLPVNLEFQEETQNQGLASKREVAVKRMSRQKKRALVRLAKSLP
jgi:predicted GIY-YIG superfamily endonuclease